MMKYDTVNTDRLRELLGFGQSYWLDNLTREMLHGGELKARIAEEGLRGVTSNPATFSNSVRSGALYDEEIAELVQKGEDSESIYESLMVEDVRQACDAFEGLYRDSDGVDGYVSIEVDPRLAMDADATLEAARDLWKKVDRPNVMIKIPATKICLPTVEEALFEGININITLIFSVERYRDVAACYLRALRRREKEGLDLKRIVSVSSFFLSRIDTKIDKYLNAAAVSPGENELAGTLRGKVAIGQARSAYEVFTSVYSSPAWRDSLQQKGALPQRLLWASTSVKDELYPDTYYVDSLIGEDTINTMPEKTAEAFSENGSLEKDAIKTAGLDPEEVVQKLGRLGIDLEAIARELEDEGIQKFVKLFEQGLRTVSRQAKQARGDAV